MQFIFIVKDYINLEEVSAVSFNDEARRITVQFKVSSSGDRRVYECSQVEYDSVKKSISDNLGKLI